MMMHHPGKGLSLGNLLPCCLPPHRRPDRTQRRTSYMKIRSSLVSLLPLLTVASLPAQDRSYGRSVVSSPYGIVATSWVQASQAGAQMLDKGGSAIDAAIAANAVLNTSEPMMNGMGGDL